MKDMNMKYINDENEVHKVFYAYFKYKTKFIDQNLLTAFMR